MKEMPVSPHRALFFGDEDPEEQARALEFTHSLAVVIGINDYRHGIVPLRTAVRDAEVLAGILHTEYDYAVQTLTQDVTLARLRTLLQDELPRQVSADDRVVFYFAGHGIALEGDDGPAGYLVPQDGRPEDRSTFLRMDEFHDALMALDCRHMLIILDCCFAGAMRWASTRAFSALPEVIHKERYERFIRDPAWQVLTSAAYDQKALDVLAGDVLGARGDAAGEHSPFARALFAALRGAGDLVPAGGGDGIITAAELYLYLRDYVEIQAEAQAGHYQTPGLWPLKKHSKGEYIFQVPGHALNLPPAPELSFDNNPYRGLQAFEEEHAALFFGRTALVNTLAEMVTRQPLTVVLGASGTGKSSVVKAGLLPHLGGTGLADQIAGYESTVQAWYILPPLRPTESPLRELESLLHHHLPAYEQVSHIGARAPQIGELLLTVLVNWTRLHPGQKLLLVIDQFEELITLCRDDHEREQFLTLLEAALAALPEQLRVVLTLRSDFAPQFVGSALDARWTAARFVIPPMSQAELREAIEGPASVRVLYFEPPALVDRLIDEVIQTPGALPLLSFTLSELYIKYVERRGDDRALNQADYEALGGVVGSLRSRTTEEYNRLPDAAHQATMQRVMLRMIASEGGELARRRVPRAELVYPDEAENARVAEVIQRLTAARLLVSGKTEEGVAYVEPAHDALVRAWDKLLTWHREAEESLPLQRRLTQAADEWAAETNERTKANLLWNEDPRLPQVEQVLAGSLETVKRSWVAQQWGRFRDLWRRTPLQAVEGHWLNQLELNFVQRSVERRRKDGRRLFITVVGVIVMLAALAVFAFIQSNLAQAAATLEAIARQEAEAERNIAQSRLLAFRSPEFLDNEFDLALLLGVQARRVTDTVEARNSLFTALGHNPQFDMFLFGHNAAVVSVAFSPNARYLASGDEAGVIILWDLGQYPPTSQLLIGHHVPVRRLVFDMDSTTLLSVAYDQNRLSTLSPAEIYQWDIQNVQLIRTLAQSGEEFRKATISSNGRGLALLAATGELVLWDVSTDEEIFRTNLGVTELGIALDARGINLSRDS